MLISDSYREQNKLLHEQRADYGALGHRFARSCLRTIDAVSAVSFLDYGCGKGMLCKELRTLLDSTAHRSCRLLEYDPAVPGKDSPPEPADVVLCNDVLEHVEPDCLGAVLGDLARVTLKRGILIASTRAAMKTLPDGRNAHLIQKPWLWWAAQVDRHFDVRAIVNDDEVRFTVGPKR